MKQREVRHSHPNLWSKRDATAARTACCCACFPIVETSVDLLAMLALLCLSRMADGGCVAYKLVQRKQGCDRWNKRFRQAILRFSIVLVSRGACEACLSARVLKLLELGDILTRGIGVQHLCRASRMSCVVVCRDSRRGQGWTCVRPRLMRMNVLFSALSRSRSFARTKTAQRLISNTSVKAARALQRRTEEEGMRCSSRATLEAGLHSL